MPPNARPLVFLLLLSAVPASAQDGGLPRWVEADPFTAGEDDPLGIDRGDQLDQVAPTTSDEEVQRAIPVRRGAVLVAIGGVSESHHEVQVVLDHGLALVTTHMRFVSRARHAAEIRYRLAVPEGASLAALEVCDARGCREGDVDASRAPLGPYDDAVRARGPGALPVAHAAVIEDDAGHALYVRAAPLRPRAREMRGVEDDRWLDLRVSYLVSAPLRGGHVRLVLPARGADNRIAPSRLRVSSTSLTGATADGVDAVERAVERAPWQAVEVAARRPRTSDPRAGVQTEIWTTPCGEGRCARVRAVASPTAPRARDVILLLDASPSTAGAAHGRIGPTVAALLSILPSRSRVRIAAFAARAEAVVESFIPPTEVSLVAVSRALERPLGSATRFEAAWALIGPWAAEARDPLVLLIGDGGLTQGAPTEAAFDAARRSGAELAVLDVADRPTTASMRAMLERASGRWIDVGAEAARATAGHGMDPLTERIAPVLAPTVARHVRARVGPRTIDLGALRAGEEVVWQGVIDRRRISVQGAARARSAGAPEALSLALRDRLERATGRRGDATRLVALADRTGAPSTCSARTRPQSPSAVVPLEGRLVLADSRRCGRSPLPHVTPTPAAPSAPTTLHRHTGRRGLPERSLLTMLRQRIIPDARRCFRDDRRGRPSYQRRAVLEFRLADREVVEARVTGSIATPLRRCLEGAMDTLLIPPFDGVVNVRYPIYTAARLPPPVLTLDTDIADEVDAISDAP